jgi:hypothetical protein
MVYFRLCHVVSPQPPPLSLPLFFVFSIFAFCCSLVKKELHRIAIMTTTSDTRSNWRTWSPAYETAPPAACQTLRNYQNAVEWGKTCVFGKEDGDPLPFSINTACMPWVTPNVYPNTAAFYSPATACPTSWSAVSTVTNGAQWVNGETALTCCPSGFEGDGRGGCRVSSSGTFPIVQCGEADAEENSNTIYTAGQWPTSATASITALQLRYQPSDIGSARASPSSTNTSQPSHHTGLSTAAKTAIGTVIPLVFILGALAFALLWRRRKHKKSALVLAAQNLADEKAPHPSESLRSSAGAYHHPSRDGKHVHPSPGDMGSGAHETPEWNVEMDAGEAEREGFMASHVAKGEASELGGTARVQRKPIAPVEIDGRSVRAEVGDAYLPYRPGV